VYTVGVHAIWLPSVYRQISEHTEIFWLQHIEIGLVLSILAIVSAEFKRLEVARDDLNELSKKKGMTWTKAI